MGQPKISSESDDINTIIIPEAGKDNTLSVFTLTKFLDLLFWHNLNNRYASGVAVGAPDRLAFVFTDAGDPGKVSRLRATIRKWVEHADHPQSDYIFVWRDSEWRVLD